MKKKIRVLQVNASNFGKGGISTTIFRLMESLKDSSVEFTFLVEKKISEEYINKIREYNGKIEMIPKTYNKKYTNWLRFQNLLIMLNKYEYEIVHINGDNCIALFPYILAAKIYHQTKIVVHAHTTGFSTKNKTIKYVKEHINMLLKKYLLANVDLKIACSLEAAGFMYTAEDSKNVYIMKNGLIPQKYQFVLEKRNAIRNELGVKNKKVIGHIGRFSYAKNHQFLIELFSVIKERNEDVELWLIGDGQEEENIKRKVHEKKLDNDVRFLGVLNNVQDYLCGMDIMVFPSKYEGLPLVLVEAQANDLAVVCSDVISNDTFFSDNVTKCSLDKSYIEWARAIEDNWSKSRRNMVNETIKAGFDMNEIAKKMEGLYNSISK